MAISTIRPCHRVNVKEEIALATKLLDAGMAKSIDESDVPVGPDAKPILGGRFAVAHARGSQRLIFDRRPQNSTEESLGCVRLPLGSQLIHMGIGDHEVVRGSGDDHECWFHALRHPPPMRSEELRRPLAPRQRLFSSRSYRWSRLPFSPYSRSDG